MSLLLDTNIAIHIRDLDREIINRIARRSTDASISVITLVELNSGTSKEASRSVARRYGLDRLLRTTASIIDCDRSVASAYGEIIAALGYSRPKLLDRLIAATAIVHGLTLVTINGPDFHDIPGLQLEVWPPPGQ